MYDIFFESHKCIKSIYFTQQAGKPFEDFLGKEKWDYPDRQWDKDNGQQHP